MANEPQDLTLAEKAEYKWLSSTLKFAIRLLSDTAEIGSDKWLKHNNKALKEYKRLDELKEKKKAYEEYKKSILNK